AHVADQEVEPPGTAPVRGEHGRGGAEVDGFAVALEFHRRRELSFAFALEEIQLPVVASREDIADAVAVQVHELWREADASAKRHADDLTVHLEPLELIQLGVVPGADVGIKPKPPFAELADEQGQAAVASYIGHEWRRVPQGHINGLTA